MTQPTIVFIGGGWHVPASYSKFTKALEAAGYDVHVPSHPSMVCLAGHLYKLLHSNFQLGNRTKLDLPPTI